MKKAIIIGCGITGPTLALSLKNAGIDSVIYEEQETPLDHVGLVLYLSPSGCNILKTLGLYDKVRSGGSICGKTEFNNHNGKKIVEFEQSNHEKIFGVNTIAIKRGEINKILRDEAKLKGISIESGKKLKDIEITDKNSVIVFFQDGTKIHGDFLVGCDGINSRTRQIIMPNTQPEYTGSFAVGGTTDTPQNAPSANTLSFNFGKKAFFAYYVMPSGKTVWWNDVRILEEEIKEKLANSNDQWKEILLDLHKDDNIFFRKLIESTKEKLLRISIFDLPTLSSWHKGPVCLTGDAAHAVAPHAGQGASLCLESAMMLAKCLRDIPDVEDAFSTYHNLRKNRVEKIKKISRRNVQMFSLKNPIQKWFRNIIFSLLSRKLMKKQELEIYGYEIDWNKKIQKNEN